ncbi:helix-turn-helix domain-containing protein [Methylobacterium nodulans]|uniref:helix-turn-helix domain-containing protein n=1 Tax=Methylobacterium nodulans TaxID=114616 RepID=UPI0001619395|nr:helix-turn-helix transcriptional regulator [Methylobacterium nodulans]
MSLRISEISLTERQIEVLHLLAQGKRGSNIAVQLGISVCTIRAHIRNAMQKLDAANIPHAVARAYVKGILS